MNTARKAIAIYLLVFSLLLSGCGSGPLFGPTITPSPTITNTPTPAPTNTFIPTFAPEPNATPDVAATQKADAFNSLLNSFVEKGYMDSTAGDIRELNPSEADWKTGSWSPNNGANSPKDFTDFLFSAHFAWDATKGDPRNLGCALVFGLQQDATSSQYILDFNKNSISLAWITQKAGSKFPYMYVIGKTSGTGRVNFKEKTETDFAALLRGESLYVSFDGAVTKYTLAKDRPTKGVLVFGRNFGQVACTMTNMIMWTPK